MFSSHIREHVIDLDAPEEERWRHVIKSERVALRRLVRAALAQYDEAGVPAWGRWLGSTALDALYRLWGGRYVGELDAIAAAAGVTRAEAVAGNCAYEVSHAGWWAGGAWGRLSRPLGCTAGVAAGEGAPLHFRVLDWPLKGLGDATRVFRFRQGSREFMTLGPLGFVGALTGMYPGHWSASINWAPPVGRPTFDWGPAFLLRETLERCDTYREAVAELRSAPLSCSVFFVVTGAAPGEGCVIERTSRAAAVRRMREGRVVCANHFVTRNMAKLNAGIREEDEDGAAIYWDSEERARVLEEEVSSLPRGASLEEAAVALRKRPVSGVETTQRILMRPASGEWRAWRRVG